MSEFGGSRFQRLIGLAMRDPGRVAGRGVGLLGRKLWSTAGVARRRLWRGAEYQRASFLTRQHFALHEQPAPQLSFSLTSELPFGYDAVIERDGGRFRVLVSSASPQESVLWLKYRLPCYAYWLAVAPPEVRRITVTLSDGNNPMSGRFSPSTNLQQVTAIPDPYFFEHNAFARFREVLERQGSAWNERSSVLVWSGATTGTGLFDPQLALERPALAAQRMQVCARLRGVAGTDVKFAYSSRPDTPIEAMDAFGLRGQRVEETSWVTRKYALDVDGNTNTWQNLIVRLHLGCCVLKVASQYDFRQWYYDRLKPWEHYVPVKADCSDLLEQIEWVRANDHEASQIARRGQALAGSLTWETTKAEAAALVTANWDRPQAA